MQQAEDRRARSLQHRSSLIARHSSVRCRSKSAKCETAAISIGSSSCRGGSMPKIRIGCRRCWWKSRSFSTAASIRSTSTATPRSSSPLRGDETVGRILVSDDPRYNEERGENLGCFGMFECDNDPAAAHALLDAAAGWLAARGRTAIRGPIDYSLNYPCGLLIEGFDTPPRIMMNHNRRYYAGLLESWGLRKAQGSLRLVVRRFARSGGEVASSGPSGLARRGRITVRPFRLNDFEAEVAPLQGDLQRRHGRPLGIRQAHRRRIPVHGQAIEATGHRRSGAAGRSRRPAGRVLDHAARHQRGDSPA